MYSTWIHFIRTIHNSMKQHTHSILIYSRIGINTFIVWLIIDQLIRITGLGSVLPDHYSKENYQRKAAPYIEFKGVPDKLDHDRHGYRWIPDIVDQEALKISFFGGSTGYQGEPPIPSLLEEKLKNNLGVPVQIANLSVVSSNHRQHLHNIIESRSLFWPDVVIFYGGFNETLSHAYYDPRPGFPYNYFYRNETSPLNQFLIRYSPTFHLIDELLTKYGAGGLTPLAELRKNEKPFSSQWNEEIIRMYFDTMMLARNVAESFESQHCEKPVFLFFYQPYQVPDEFIHVHDEIRKTISNNSFG